MSRKLAPRRRRGRRWTGGVERRDWKPSSLAALSTFEGTLDMRRGNILGSAGAAGNWKPPLGAAGLENCSPVTAGAARARATSFIVSCRFCLTTAMVLSQRRTTLSSQSGLRQKARATSRPAGAGWSPSRPFYSIIGTLHQVRVRIALEALPARPRVAACVIACGLSTRESSKDGLTHRVTIELTKSAGP